MGSLPESQSPSKRNVTSTDISSLRSLLNINKDRTRHDCTKLLAPGDQGFEASLHRWSRAAEQLAGAVLLPTSVDAISTTLKYASAQSISIAVRGGGHSTTGASSTNGGLVVDLAEMRGVTVDPEKQTLTIQGGAVWSGVDTEAAKFGLATVGGTVPDTGVGGLTLGGGYGLLTGQRGLVVDNLLEVTTVLANGEVVKASMNENQDLFWGLRGAGQNFGVAVEFVIQAYPQKDVWAGILMYPATRENLTRVVEISNELYVPQEKTAKTGLKGRGAGGIGFARPPPAGGQVVVMVPIFFDGSKEEGKEIFKPFLDLGPMMSTVATLPYTVANTMLQTPQGFRVSMKGVSFRMPMRPDFMCDVLNEFAKFTEAPDAAASMVFLEFMDPTKVVQAAGNDDMAFANRGFQLNGMVAPFWMDAGNDKISRQWARDMAALFKKEIQREGEETGKGPHVKGSKEAVMLYGNYDQYDEKSKDIFGGNYQRLQVLKARYDPENMFNKLFAVVPEVDVRA